MKKVAASLLIMATLTSSFCFADKSHFNSAIMNSFNSHGNNQSSQHSLSIIYGGKDISRPQMAAANQSLWAGEQPKLVL